jgi:hypothetical protein
LIIHSCMHDQFMIRRPCVHKENELDEYQSSCNGAHHPHITEALISSVYIDVHSYFIDMSVLIFTRNEKGKNSRLRKN